MDQTPYSTRINEIELLLTRITGRRKNTFYFRTLWKAMQRRHKRRMQRERHSVIEADQLVKHPA